MQMNVHYVEHIIAQYDQELGETLFASPDFS